MAHSREIKGLSAMHSSCVYMRLLVHTCTHTTGGSTYIPALYAQTSGLAAGADVQVHGGTEYRESKRTLVTVILDSLAVMRLLVHMHVQTYDTN